VERRRGAGNYHRGGGRSRSRDIRLGREFCAEGLRSRRSLYWVDISSNEDWEAIVTKQAGLPID